jgi:hypothetical protein
MPHKHVAFALLILSCTAVAEEPAPPESAPAKASEPIFFFELPNRGALAVQLDNLAIRAGTSGSLKNAKSAIEMANSAKGTLSVFCKDGHTALPTRKDRWCSRRLGLNARQLK